MPIKRVLDMMCLDVLACMKFIDAVTQFILICALFVLLYLHLHRCLFSCRIFQLLSSQVLYLCGFYTAYCDTVPVGDIYMIAVTCASMQ